MKKVMLPSAQGEKMKMVGYIDGTTFIRRAEDGHLYRGDHTPELNNSWGFNVTLVEHLRKLGVKKIVVVFHGLREVTTLMTLLEHGKFRPDTGFGEQLFLNRDTYFTLASDAHDARSGGGGDGAE